MKTQLNADKQSSKSKCLRRFFFKYFVFNIFSSQIGINSFEIFRKKITYNFQTFPTVQRFYKGLWPFYGRFCLKAVFKNAQKRSFKFMKWPGTFEPECFGTNSGKRSQFEIWKKHCKSKVTRSHDKWWINHEV
jgi:hypothetical protein